MKQPQTATFNQMRYADYREDEISVTLRSSFGDYGGGSEVLVLESNQNHATAQDTEISPTLPAAMGMGGYVPMIVQRVYDPSRRHDYEEWETVCGTLENRMGTGGATCR